ncbi:MAG: hypothetical protein DMD90_27730 [Candidatus Rokuibacteriota bacterium]|nr:MAG: hypothetical protein DMD90_27730 [Candidatus Rokubacteria bacterium]
MNARPELLLGLAALIALTTAAIVDPQPPGAHLRLAEAQDARDTRERIRLEPSERDAVLAEMRTMLKSLNRIMHGLAAGDTVMVEDAARASGAKAALSPQLGKKLPAHFQDLERRVHQRFDQLADAVKSGTRDDVVKRMAALTGYCVTCHDTYRLDEAK